MSAARRHGLAPDGGARRCLKCLVGDFAEEIFVGLVEFGGGGAVVPLPATVDHRTSKRRGVISWREKQ
jgi:hypothetical protein